MSEQNAHNLAQIRDQLLNSFTAAGLYDLFLYSDNPNFQPLTKHLNRRDSLVDMVTTVIEYCHTRDLLDQLLAEVKDARPQDTPSAAAVGLAELDIDGIRAVIEASFDLDKCFVRDPELRELAGRAHGGRHTALVGDHGAGKTTLLQKLPQLLDPATHRVGYLDLAEPDFQFPSILYRRLVTSVGFPDPGDIGPFELRRLLEESPTDHLVACLDNFDVWAGRKTLDQALLGTLRSLGSHRLLSFQIASTVHLETLQPSGVLMGSPYFNIFAGNYVATLSEHRARKLLEGAGVTDLSQVAFCFETVEKRLPLDLLLVSYLLQQKPPKDSKDYERIQRKYKAAIAALGRGKPG